MTRHLAIVGPTATGKSELALAVATARPGAEIVSLDSMQVYRGMDIGTAKPSPAERSLVPHHLIDVADPDEEWSVARTRDLARAAIADIEARGGSAVLVGGTGLYVRAVVDDLSIPPEDRAVRARLTELTADEAGRAAAYARLQAVDPVAAARIEPDNQRRIVRALEVVEITGRPFSSFGPGLETYGEPAIDCTIVGCAVARAALAARIEQRFAGMRDDGLVDEVARLLADPRGLSRTAAQAIGYKEIIEHLRGATTLDAALDLAVRRTRQLARRQRVWFERDPRIAWIPTDRYSEPPIDAVLASWSAPTTTGRAP